jgi:hypothetical protein
MAVKISQSDNIDAVQFQEQASDPTTPVSGYGKVYVKDDNGLYFKDDTGTVVGPLTGTSSYGDIVQAITELSAGVSAGSTTIAVKGLIEGALPDAIWVIIDPFGSKCEFRQVTGISTLTLTITSLSFDHTINTPVWYLLDPIVNVKWFGAKGGSTDDAVAIQAALNSMIVVGGGIVYLPNGSYFSSSGLQIRADTSFVGCDKNRTLLNIETTDTIGIDITLDSSISNMSISYKNTSDAGSLTCYGIKGYVSNANVVRALENIVLSAHTANSQTAIYGIVIAASYYSINPNFSQIIPIIMDRVTAYSNMPGETGYSYAIWMVSPYASNFRAYAIDLTAYAYGGSDSRGIMVDGPDVTESRWILHNCYGRSRGAQGAGIYVQHKADLYSCYGYMEGNAQTSAVYGIFNIAPMSRMFDCYGYSYQNAIFHCYGIWVRCDEWTEILLSGCIAEAENPGTGTAYGLRAEGSVSTTGKLIILNGQASGEVDVYVVYNEAQVYGLQYETTNFTFGGSIVALQGDRSAWDITAYANEHASDINASALLRHLPAPGTAGKIVVDDGSNWVVGDQSGMLCPNVAKTSDYTLTTSDDKVAIDATSNNVTITLPPVSGNTGREYTVNRIDSSVNTATLTGNGSETINDSADQTLTQYDFIHVYCDGTEWWII